MGHICSAEKKHWTMDEFIAYKMGHTKRTLIVLLLYTNHYHFTQAAYPLERDVAELTRVSPPKRWIPFMERLARICLNDVKIKEYMTLIDTLKCMTLKDTTHCFDPRYPDGCMLIHYHPNILAYEDMAPFLLPIHIIVHQQFSLNITVKHVSAAYYKYIRPSFEIVESGYTEQNCSTIIIPQNSIKIVLYDESSIEYSVTQYLNATDYHQIRSNVMQLAWGYFLVTCFQIQVDLRARLSLDSITCLLCKMIVYDGPNEKLPIILKIADADRFQRVVASTFQVFIVIIENIPQKDTLVSYSPVYNTKTVFNLTQDARNEIRFDNSTWCDGHSWYARSCVYTFHASAGKRIRFSLEDLQFKETERTTKYKAGIIIFNKFEGTTENIVELNLNLGLQRSYVEIIVTGYTVHIVVFVYSILSHLTFTFSMSLSDCDVLLVSGKYITYSDNIVPMDDTLRVFEINKSLHDFQKYDKRLRLQFITPVSTYRIIFPHSIPVQIVKYNGQLGLCEDCSFPCPISFEGPPWAFYRTGDRMEIRIIDSFTIEPCSFRYMQIIINRLPC